MSFKNKLIINKRPMENKELTGVGLATTLPEGLTDSQIVDWVTYVRLEEVCTLLKGDPTNLVLEKEMSYLLSKVLIPSFEADSTSDYSSWLEKNSLAHNCGGPNTESGFSDYNDTGSIAGYSGGGGGSGSVPLSNFRVNERVWIPQRDFPDINFVGLLIGPRGNTLKKMEQETGAKISIRGRGSIKEGKTDAASLAAADEELHAMVMGDNIAMVQKAIIIINQIIETAVRTPEESNELKRNQLRELASINGTLRDEIDTLTCSNCGQAGHRRFECPEKTNVTSYLVCKTCGQSGHLTSDCLHRDNPEMLAQSSKKENNLEDAYQDFLADIN